MEQTTIREVTVNIAVNPMEFFQWGSGGLKDRDEVEKFTYDQDVVWMLDNPGETISREELAQLLDDEQMIINSYNVTVQDIELTINNKYLVIIADECPFIPVLNN